MRRPYEASAIGPMQGPFRPARLPQDVAGHLPNGNEALRQILSAGR